MTWMENTSRSMKWQTSATLLPLPSWINFFKYGFQPSPPLTTTASPLLTTVAINIYNFGFALCCHQHRIWGVGEAWVSQSAKDLGSSSTPNWLTACTGASAEWTIPLFLPPLKLRPDCGVLQIGSYNSCHWEYLPFLSLTNAKVGLTCCFICSPLPFLF